jgi:hypothetical protein
VWLSEPDAPIDISTKSGSIKIFDGFRIHYIEAGEGKAIVLIPGRRVTAWIWQKQIDELSKKVPGDCC